MRHILSLVITIILGYILWQNLVVPMLPSDFSAETYTQGLNISSIGQSLTDSIRNILPG